MRHATSTSSYPALLGAQVAHAHRFARALRALYDDAATGDASVLWLTGRADEVTAFVDDVLREWAVDRNRTMHATAVIEDYLHGLHEAMEPWFGQWFAPSCCGPFGRIRQSGIRATPARPRLKRVDSLTDTMTDAAPLLGVAYGA